jgi:hypothetical protein
VKVPAILHRLRARAQNLGTQVKVPAILHRLRARAQNLGTQVKVPAILDEHQSVSGPVD